MRAEQGGRGRQMKLKESGKKERRESLSIGQEAWLKQRPPVTFNTQFSPSGIVTESQLGSWPPHLRLHIPGSIAASVITWLHSSQWNENGNDVSIYLLWRKSLASVPSSSLSHGLFVPVVSPGFAHTEEDRVTSRGWQSNKTEGTVVRCSFFQPQWEAKQPLGLDWGVARESGMFFGGSVSRGCGGRISFQQLSLNLNWYNGKISRDFRKMDLAIIQFL